MGVWAVAGLLFIEATTIEVDEVGRDGGKRHCLGWRICTGRFYFTIHI